MIILKKMLVMAVFTMITSALVFGWGIELGAGGNVMGAFPIPAVEGSVIIPISGPLSLTGQITALLAVGETADTPAYMVLGGGRYTFDMKGVKFFIGADAGMLTKFFTFPNSLIFGANAGMNFGMFYVKGAMRMVRFTSTGETTAPQSKLIPLGEITGGLCLEF